MTYTELVKLQAKPGQYYLVVWDTEEYQDRPYWHGWPPVLYLYETAKEALRQADELRGSRYWNPRVQKVVNG